MSLRHTIHGLYKGVAEAVLPPRSASGGFRETGVLTPDEFVAAGDFLVATCPSWSWQARPAHASRPVFKAAALTTFLFASLLQGGERSKQKPYLPAEKQFLITRNVPCFKRAAAVEGALGAGEAMVEGAPLPLVCAQRLALTPRRAQTARRATATAAGWRRRCLPARAALAGATLTQSRPWTTKPRRSRSRRPRRPPTPAATPAAAARTRRTWTRSTQPITWSPRWPLRLCAQAAAAARRMTTRRFRTWWPASRRTTSCARARTT